MSEENTTEKSTETQTNIHHFLALIIEVQPITAYEASRKLGVDIQTAIRWSKTLSAEGLIECDPELTDPPLTVTKKGKKTLENIEKQWVDFERRELEKEEKQKPQKPKTSPAEKLKKTLAKIRSLWADTLLTLSVLILIHFLRIFLMDPNAQALSFLFASVLASLLLLMIHQYRKTVDKMRVVTFVKWTFNTANAQRRIIAFIIVLWFILYSLGMIILNPENLSPYLVMTILSASTIHLIYSPKNTIRESLKFYFGILLLCAGLLLIAGLESLTDMLFESKSRLIDLFFGLGFILLAYINQEALGLKRLLEKTPGTNETPERNG
jgi:DNA-binding MarR family transcriptional regulator